MSFADDLKAEFEADKPTRDVEIPLNGNLYTLRFERMDGTDWTLATDAAPARPGVLLDMRYGYNLRALVPPVAEKTGKLVDGDNLVDVSEDQWRAIFKGAGATVSRIGDAIFALNEYDPAAEVEALKKVSAGGRKRNSV
jgi:hypothetical protein